jgi:arsenate reductase
MIIYYNPRCGKCREALSLLKEENCEVEIREYLKEPPDKKELKALVQKLKCKPFDLVRRSEPLYIEKFKDKKLTDAQWLKALSENPILIERPIVIDGENAVVGRPPVLVLDLVKGKKSI